MFNQSKNGAHRMKKKIDLKSLSYLGRISNGLNNILTIREDKLKSVAFNFI